MLNPFEELKVPMKVEDFKRSFVRRASRVQAKNAWDRNEKLLKILEGQIENYRSFILSLREKILIHPFYAQLFELRVGGEGEERIDKTLAATRIALKILRDHARVRRGESGTYSEVIGRVFSVLSRKGRDMDRLIDTVLYLEKLDYIDPDENTVIIAGPPNSGKSSIVAAISTAKPEIASYPFTTKEIHVGHIILKDVRIQVLDTPGILDRPLTERNPIEKRAIAALKSLKGVVVVILDVSTESIYTAEEQLRVLKDIVNVSSNKKLIVVMNKVDLLDTRLHTEISEGIKEMGLEALETSVKQGRGLRKLIEEILEFFS
jgi:nucleolar GTP-binding protein